MQILEQFDKLDSLIKLTLSDTNTFEYKKVIIHPIILKDKALWQIELHTIDKVYHKNVDADTLHKFLSEVYLHFNQITFFYQGESIIFSKKGSNFKAKTTENNLKVTRASHNKQKQYILNEGENIPALVDLGVFSPTFTINKAKFDKFKQINRFIEIVDDAFCNFDKKSVTILDFGCGKSYLTFILYHYFVNIKHIDATVIGYDLKADVVEHCNQVAAKYGYTKLKFFVNDVSKGDLFKGDIDMIITLHACDTATDYALDFAIKNNVRHIFSVPCCQHEINQSITPNGDFDIILKHGILHERFCALLTDAIRAEILHQKGYSVDMLEFVDFSHSPKNIMIRATKTTNSKRANFDIDALQRRYGFNQTLHKLNK